MYIANKYDWKNKGIDDQKYLNNHHLQAVMAVMCTGRGLIDVGELFVKKTPKLKKEKVVNTTTIPPIPSGMGKRPQ